MSMRCTPVWPWILAWLAAAWGGCERAAPGEGAAATPPAKTARPAAAAPDRVLEDTVAAGRSALQQGAYRRALRLAQDGLKRVAGHPERHGERARLLWIAAEANRHLSAPQEARRFLAEAAALYRVFDDPAGMLDVLISAALVELSVGDTAACGRYLDEAQTVAPKVDDPVAQAQLATARARWHMARLAYDEALPLLDQALKAYEKADDAAAQGRVLLHAARCHDGRGNAAMARRAFDKAASLFAQAGQPAQQAAALVGLANLYIRDKKTDRARTLLQRAKELYAQQNRISEATAVDRHLAALPE